MNSQSNCKTFHSNQETVDEEKRVNHSSIPDGKRFLSFRLKQIECTKSHEVLGNLQKISFI